MTQYTQYSSTTGPEYRLTKYKSGEDRLAILERMSDGAYMYFKGEDVRKVTRENEQFGCVQGLGDMYADRLTPLPEGTRYRAACRVIESQA